jgi:heme O synthase-like polyprenyltransferase
VKNTKERNLMTREVSLFGALVPSLLLYFLAAIPLFLMIDWLASPLGLYRLVWHPPLVRLALFVCLFSGLVLLTRP